MTDFWPDAGPKPPKAEQSEKKSFAERHHKGKKAK